MKTREEILNAIETIFKNQWVTREGTKVPEPEDLKLGNEAVILDGTILYADMTESTQLVDGYKNFFAAEIYKSYLYGACEIIRNNSGTITSFDGDRVMAIFIGTSKNSSAAKAGLQINALAKEINTLLSKHYKQTSYNFQQKIGIDASKIFATRTGIRKYNDIVWVGPAANYAAKLCSLANENYTVVLSEKVYKLLNDSSKFGGNPKQDMWKKDIWPETNGVIYRSNWHWNF